MNNSQIKQALKNVGVKNYSKLNRMELLKLASIHIKNEPIWKSLLNEERRKHKQKHKEDLIVQHGGSKISKLENIQFKDNYKTLNIEQKKQIQTILQDILSLQEPSNPKYKNEIAIKIANMIFENTLSITINGKMNDDKVFNTQDDSNESYDHAIKHIKQYVGHKDSDLTEFKQEDMPYVNTVYMILYVLFHALFDGGLNNLKSVVNDIQISLAKINEAKAVEVFIKKRGIARRENQILAEAKKFKLDKLKKCLKSSISSDVPNAADAKLKFDTLIECVKSILQPTPTPKTN